MGRRAPFGLIVTALTLLLAAQISALQETTFEGTAHGYPVMLDISGRQLAVGDFTQWVTKGGIHVRIAYDFPGGRRVIEDIVFRQRPELKQESWRFRDLDRKHVTRDFTVD